MHGWQEVGDGVYCRRYQPWDVTVGAIRGSAGLLVVDTRASLRQADELLRDLSRLDARAPAWVVNTHFHFDHTFGNAAFLPAPLWGHVSVPGALAAGRHEAPDDPEYAQAVLVPPDHLVLTTADLDLGDRRVELHHLGREHTDGDLVVWVPDAAVLFAGDLVEESGPPAYGEDSFPLDWPATAGRLLDLAAEPRIVPGHGSVVDHRFVAGQREGLAAVAGLARELWAAGVPADEALAAGEDRWPWPPAGLARAVRRAYRQLSEGGGTGG